MRNEEAGRANRSDDSWKLAAMLSQIGCVAIPDDVFDRLAAGEELSPTQVAMMDGHPQIARDLLKKIPRLQTVAAMIFLQRPQPTAIGADSSPAAAAEEAIVIFGGGILAAALQFEELVSLGAAPDKRLAAMRQDGNEYDADVLNALMTVELVSPTTTVRLLSLSKAKIGMSLEESIRKKDGTLVVPSGHEITTSSLTRLRNYAALGLLEKQEFRVRDGPAQPGTSAAAA